MRKQGATTAQPFRSKSQNKSGERATAVDKKDDSVERGTGSRPTGRSEKTSTNGSPSRSLNMQAKKMNRVRS